MRLGVLDIGSNSAHLQLVDAEPGAPPLPAFGRKFSTRLESRVSPDGSIPADVQRDLFAAIGDSVATAVDHGVEELIAFATSAMRDAPNSELVRAEIERRFGIAVRLLSGQDEARFTFLAARRWVGWQAGPILLFDIGGGSFEIAYGRDEHPNMAVS
ncbi:MAG TPA: hypothetical protein VKW77_03800, partial [Acidimicrobiales bacterium]|nr:hypothetical protein [Acidimicrobiales bacterium]